LAGRANVDSDGWLLAAFAGMSAFLALVQILVLSMSCLSMPMTRMNSWLIVLGSSLGSILFAWGRGDRRVGGPRHVGEGHDNGLVGKVTTFIAAGAALLALIVFVRLWVIAAYLPPMSFDGLAYHLPAVHRWVLRGRVCWYAVDEFLNGYPMATEVIMFIMYYLCGSEMLVDTANLWFLPLGVLGLALIARTFGAKRDCTLLSAALFLFVPIVVVQGATCLVDIAFACSTIGVVASSCLILRMQPSPGWWGGLLWGANVGLMAGSKATGAPFLALSVLGLFWIMYRRRHHQKRSVRWTFLATAGIAATLVGGFWYIRNVIVTGNPLYPYRVAVGPWVFVDGWDPYGHLSVSLYAEQVPALTRYVRAWPEPLMFLITWLQPAGSSHTIFGGLGHFWYVAAIPSVILAWALALRRSEGKTLEALGLVTALVSAMFLVQPARWWGRLTIWLYALGIPCFALGLQRALGGKRDSFWRKIWLALGLAVTGAALWDGTSAVKGETERLRYFKALVRTERPVACTPLRVHFGMLEGTVFEKVLASGRVAHSRLQGYTWLLSGFFSMPLGKREIRMLGDQVSESDVAQLDSQGFEWVVWDDSIGPCPEPLRQMAIKTTRLEVPDDRYIYVFQLR